MNKLLAVAIGMSLVPAVTFAQGHNVTLHVNPRWKQCSFQLDPALTQAAWHQFTGEAGAVGYFRPLVGAEPLGAGRWELSVMQWTTGIDDTDPAWNDTFVHPDSTHWLFEGSGLGFPGLAVRAGVSSRMDLGVYFTKNPGANYGFYGAQLQHNIIRDAAQRWFGSARVSFVSLYGPADLDFTVIGLDLVASRKFPVFSGRALVSPYVGFSSSMSRAHEKTAAVNLKDEYVGGGQAFVGIATRFSVARIGIEYGMASVQSLSLKVGIGR